MYLPFYKNWTSHVEQNDGVPVNPNFPETQKCNELTTAETFGPKTEKLDVDNFDTVEQKVLERRKIRKSPMPYIGMIAEAISSSPDKKMVLSDIYSYMEKHFCEYLTGKPRWRNTVRHNLSFHSCFVKCECSARGNRSHFWSVHPDFIQQFKRGNFTKTLAPAREQVNMSRLFIPKQQVLRRNSHGNYHRFLPNTGFENFPYYNVCTIPSNPNTLYQVFPSTTNTVSHQHQNLRSFTEMQNSFRPRGNTFHKYKYKYMYFTLGFLH